MDTHFAPAARTSYDEIASEIQIVSNDAIMSGLLNLTNGLLAILDANRQIVAVNDSFMKILPEESLGLRLGEALCCVHAGEEQAGCGTSKFCSSCGAAIAMVSCLNNDKPIEKMCALTVNRGDRNDDIALMVRSQSIKIDRKKFLLLFLQDVTRQQQRAALERTFFHDVNNMLNGLVGASELLSLSQDQSELVGIIRRSSMRLKNEVDMQRYLLQSKSSLYEPSLEKADSKEVIEELKSFFYNHPKAENRKLYFSEPPVAPSFTTDMSLLLRVLCNMVTNALEATEEGGEVKIWSDNNDSSISFYVWNQKPIPQDIAPRVFQLNFSTKRGAGRGLGTYSMKLFGEKTLGGRVSFTTSPEKGTIFKISLTYEKLPDT